MINRVVLVGRLTRDVELRYTTSGAAVGTFSLAVNRQFTNANGEREADFINCVIWRKSAENLANFTTKGSQIAVEGRLQTRNYENQQGQRVFVTEVVVDNFSLLDSKANTEHKQQSNGNTFNGSSSNGSPKNTTPYEPSNRYGGKNNDPFGGGQGANIPDDDVAF